MYDFLPKPLSEEAMTTFEVYLVEFERGGEYFFFQFPHHPE